MALTKYTASTAIIAALADLPNATDGLTAAQLKAKFDENPEAFKTFVNTLIDQLESTTDSSSGADQIGATSITDLTGNTVQALLESLKALVDSQLPTPDGSITNTKLATDVKVGSLASLTTTNKTSVVAAVNERLADSTKYVKYTKTANQSITTSVNSQVTFQTKVASNGENFSEIDAVTERIKILEAGVYEINVTFLYEGNATGARYINLGFDGIGSAPSIGTLSMYMTASVFFQASVNDLVEVIAHQSSGASLNLLSSGTTAKIRQVAKL